MNDDTRVPSDLPTDRTGVLIRQISFEEYYAQWSQLATTAAKSGYGSIDVSVLSAVDASVNESELQAQLEAARAARLLEMRRMYGLVVASDGGAPSPGDVSAGSVVGTGQEPEDPNRAALRALMRDEFLAHVDHYAGRPAPAAFVTDDALYLPRVEVLADSGDSRPSSSRSNPPDTSLPRSTTDDVGSDDLDAEMEDMMAWSRSLPGKS